MTITQVIEELSKVREARGDISVKCCWTQMDMDGEGYTIDEDPIIHEPDVIDEVWDYDMKYYVGCFVECKVEAGSREEAIKRGWEKFSSLGISPNGPDFWAYEVEAEKVNGYEEDWD